MKNKYTNKRVPIEFLYADQKVKIGEYASTSNKALIKILREIINDDLTKLQKQYLVMYYVKRMKISEIALKFGVNKATVSRTIRRARNRIYEKLKYVNFRSFVENEDMYFICKENKKLGGKAMELEYTQTHPPFFMKWQCVALETTDCVNCKFGKTTKQYNKENDNSIKRCREKGLCITSKYRKHKCHLSTEKIREASFQGGMWGA